MTKKLLGLLLAGALSLSLGASPVLAQVQPTSACDTAVVEGVVTIAWIECLVGNLLGYLPPLVIIAAIFMVIFAGIRLISAGNDPKAYQQGMQTLLYAVVGVLALGFIWFILVAIQQFTGANVTEIRFGV
jgi:hypothetical protein